MAFDASKREIMHKLQEVIDKSPKGSVDAPIVDMITRLNAHPNYVTCSSCSGRIAVFCGVAQTPHDEDSHLITKGGKWLVSSHAPVTYDEFASSVLADPTSLQGMVIFKHEPFIMHVQCRDEESAKALLQVGLACGFRESGVVLGNKRTMVAIRTTANAMEIPIALQGQLMVTDAYLRWILDIANQKFHANRSKTDKLFAAMRTSLFFDSPPAPTDASTCTSRLTQLHVTESSRLAISRAGHATVLAKTWKQWPSFPSDALLVNHTMTYDEEAKAVVVVGGSCQCFGFGAVYSPAFILDTQTKLLSNKAPSTQSLTNHELLVVVVTKPRVKAIKTLVEALAVYDKSRRIQPIPDVAGYFTVPVMDSFRDHDHPVIELKHLPVTQAHVAAAAVAEHAQLEGTVAIPDEVPVVVEVVAEQVAVSTVDDSKALLHAVLVAKDSVKSIKTHLERLSLYDKTRRIHPHMLTALDIIVDDLRDVKPELNPTVVLHSLLQTFATAHDLAPVAAKFEFIADVLVLPKVPTILCR
ncbi:hypothetical protein DYB35_005215 [Aphanomyces astaci]|uniref:tRNA wybutosine-synthesizing protein 3 n=1 Tax=Aphanomyces astaci TaxID=112090 RepID=A0A418DLH2_APHAT|nr:hypothetical protein DYB35_005215 [Aphanomyces astaci]